MGKTKLSQLVEIEEHAGLVAGIQMKNVSPNTNGLGLEYKGREVREAPPFTTGEAPYLLYTQNSFESSISSLDNGHVSVGGGGKYRYGYANYNPVPTTRSQPVQDAIPKESTQVGSDLHVPSDVKTQLLATKSQDLQGPVSSSSANRICPIIPSHTQKLDVTDVRAQVAGIAQEVAQKMSQGPRSSAQSRSPKSQHTFASPTQSVSDPSATPAAPTRQSSNKVRGTAHATSSLFQGSRFPGVAYAVAPESSFPAFVASLPRSRDSHVEAPSTNSGSAPIDLNKRISNVMKGTADITSTAESGSEAIVMNARIDSVMKRTTDMSGFIEETRRMTTAGSQPNPERKEVLSPRQTQQHHLLRHQQAGVHDQPVYLAFVSGEVAHIQSSPSMCKRQAHRSVQPPPTWSPHMNHQEYHPAYREPSPAMYRRNARSIPGELPRVCLPPSEMSRSSTAQQSMLHYGEPSCSYNDDRIPRYTPYEERDVSDFGHRQQQSYEDSRVRQRFIPSQTCSRGYVNEKSLHYQGFDGEYQSTESQQRFCGYEQFHDGEDPERMEYHEDDEYDLVADSRHPDFFPDDRVFGEAHAHGWKVESISQNLSPPTFDFWRQATSSESRTGGPATRTSTSAAPKTPTRKATKYANDRSTPSSADPCGRYIKNERTASQLPNLEQVLDYVDEMASPVLPGMDVVRHRRDRQYLDLDDPILDDIDRRENYPARYMGDDEALSPLPSLEQVSSPNRDSSSNGRRASSGDRSNAFVSRESNSRRLRSRKILSGRYREGNS